MSIHDQAIATAAYSPHSSRWFIRRAIIGLLILTVSIVGSAALLYASIDQSQDQARQTSDVQSEE